MKAEIHDLQEEHIKERQELEQTQNELTRELKLKYASQGLHSVRTVVAFSGPLPASPELVSHPVWLLFSSDIGFPSLGCLG